MGEPIQMQRYRVSTANTPPGPPFDGGGGSGDDGGMEARLNRLEQDVAVIKSNYCTRECLHQELNAQTWKFVTWTTVVGGGLVTAAFFIARYVH